MSGLIKLRLYSGFFSHSVKRRGLLEYVCAGLYEYVCFSE